MTPEVIRRLRKRLGLTQAELAHELGMRVTMGQKGRTGRSVQRWERGQCRPSAMALTQLVRLVEALRADGR
jgi:transcriptional regulator with XRE-family HTH domain